MGRAGHTASTPAMNKLLQQIDGGALPTLRPTTTTVTSQTGRRVRALSSSSSSSGDMLLS